MEDTFEEPDELTPQNIVYWSSHYKKLVVEGGETAKGAKARKIIELKLIDYVKKNQETGEKGYYICKPLPGNKTTHKMNSFLLHEFDCDCQEYQTTHRTCSHILALFMQLKIWNYNRKKDKEKFKEFAL
ncbi:MAG: SWIM zinc finger family protein [Chloroflexi bacterium]|nr:SWIM zinc finger family protein [Chloroflexota bacterium]